MKHLRSLCVLCGLTSSLHATTITSYAAHADVSPAGNATVRVTLKLEQASAGRVVVPVGFNNLTRLEPVFLPHGVTLDAPEVLRGSIEIALQEDVASDITLEFAFETTKLMGKPKVEEGKKPELAADTQLLKHSFVNTQERPIGDYRLLVVLPDGIQVQAVREQTPKPKRSDVLPRVQLGALGGRQTALLQLPEVMQGDRTAVTLETVTEERSIGWLLIGLALCVFYLLNFKDLVARAKA